MTAVAGSTTWKFSVSGDYYVERADAFAPRWLIGFGASPVVESVFARLFER